MRRLPNTPWSTTVILGVAVRSTSLALAIDHEAHRQAGAHQRRFLKRLKAVDRIPVDRLHQVAGLEAGGRGRAARLDPPDARHMFNPAEGHEHAGENDKGQNEIGDRSREHDRGAVPQRLTRRASTTDRPTGSLLAPSPTLAALASP